MKKIAVVHHSGNGHTEQFAHHVAAGARDIDGTSTSVRKTTDMTVMAQAGHSAPGDGFAPGDLGTAEALGRNFASVPARTHVSVEEVS